MPDAGRIMMREAEVFAIGAHGNQKYGFFPYYKHLKDVVRICEPYGTYRQTLAWLHDVLEDTTVTMEQLTQVFGTDVAYDVKLLTDPEAPTRAERKRLLNIQLGGTETPSSVLIVKAADRLANVRQCSHGNIEMLEKYRAEHQQFKFHIYHERLCDPIWFELDNRINGSWNEF